MVDLTNVPNHVLDMLLDVGAERHKRLAQEIPENAAKPEDVNNDKQDAPLTDSQAGDQAGVQSYNNVVPELNKIQQDAKALGGKYNDPELQKAMDEGNAQKFQNAIQAGQPDLQYQSQPEVDDTSRNPASKTNPFSSGATDLATPQNVTAKPAFNNPLAQMQDVPVQKVGTPQKVEQADQAGETKQGIADLLRQSSTNEAYAQNAGQIAGQAEKDIAEGNQKAHNEAAALEQNRADAALKIANDAQAKAEDIGQSFKNELATQQKIDPNRLYNSGNFLNKFAFLISASAGGLQKGGPLDNLVQNDIRAQEADLKSSEGRATNYISLIEKYVGNRQAAIGIYSSAVHDSINELTKAKEAGVKASDSVIMNTINDKIQQRIQEQAKNKQVAIGLGINEQKAIQEGKNMDAKNKLEAAKVNNEAAKLQLEKSDMKDGEREGYKYVANNARNLQTINNNRRLGVNPSDATFQAFAKTALKNGMTNQAIATALNTLAIPSNMKAKYIESARAIDNVIRENAIDESGTRITGDKLEEYAKTMGPKYIDNNESLDSLMRDAEDRIRSTAGSLSGKTLLNLGKNQPSTVKYLQKSKS